MKRGLFSVSIVLYQQTFDEVQSLLHVLGGSEVVEKVWLIDNGGAGWARTWSAERPARFVYIDVGRNVGFGSAHNRVLPLLPATVSHHVFCNPDISITPEALAQLAYYLQTIDAPLVMPHVMYPDGRRQELCKLLPTPLNLFARRFLPWLGERLDRRYLLRDADYTQPFFAPSLSGCFMVCRVDALQTVGGFDERYFMYMEDIDLSRRLAEQHASGMGSLYMPQITIVHAFQKGSYKHGLLLKYHIQSAIRYFNKWGWCFDAGRRRLNRQCLCHLPRQGKQVASEPFSCPINTDNNGHV